ncbi:MAG TPA: hypothetical protein V6C96_04235 [Vampirovibrionales bacterium]
MINKNKNTNIFAVFVNLLGIISALLYFSGWIYRLAYFKRLGLNIIELNFSIESFLLMPVVLIFSKILKAIIIWGPFKFVFILILVLLAFCFTIRVLGFLKVLIYKALNKLPFLKKESRNNFKVLDRFFVIEILVTTFVLFIIFQKAWLYGYQDGIRDLNTQTSLLPKVQILANEDIPLTTSRILQKREDWRLLLRQEDWIYLLSPEDKKAFLGPQVLLITKGEAGDKMLVLRPN